MKNTDFIIQDLRMAIDRELMRANELHGEVLHSKHEAVAVLGEEVDEAQDEARWLGMEMSRLWEAVKGDYADVERVEPVQRCAENLAAEAIQVTAMCEKWKMNADGWERNSPRSRKLSEKNWRQRMYDREMVPELVRKLSIVKEWLECTGAEMSGDLVDEAIECICDLRAEATRLRMRAEQDAFEELIKEESKVK